MPDYNLELLHRSQSLEKYSGLMKQILNCLAIMTIPISRGKRGKVCKPLHAIPTMKHESNSIIFCVCFTAGETDALHKIDGIMIRKLCGYIEAISRFCKWSMTPRKLLKLWQNGLWTTKSKCQNGHHKSLISI